MKMHKKILIMVLLLAAVLQGYGQVMNLQDCMRYARDNSNSNKQNELSYKSAKLDTKSALAQFLPYISASTGGSLSFGRSIDPETNTYNTNKYLSNSYSASLSLPLFDGLTRVNYYRMMRAVEKRAQQQKQIEQDKVSLSVMNAYYNCIYYSQLVKQVQKQLEGDRETLRLTTREEELGTKSGTDVAQVEANVASDEFSLIQQQNLYEAAMLTLKYNMSYPLDSVLDIDDSLLELVPSQLELESPQELFARATSYLPEVLAAAQSLKYAKYNVRRANGNFLPSLSFGAGISTSYYVNLDNRDAYATFRSQLDNNIGKYLSVSMSIPIFTRFSNTINRKSAKLNYISQQSSYEQTMQTVENDIKQAVMDVNASITEYNAAVKKFSSVELAHKANQRKFELGVLSALEYYTSTTQLATAQAQCTGKHVQYLIKKKQLDYYKGIPFINE